MQSIVLLYSFSLSAIRGWLSRVQYKSLLLQKQEEKEQHQRQQELEAVKLAEQQEASEKSEESQAAQNATSTPKIPPKTLPKPNAKSQKDSMGPQNKMYSKIWEKIVDAFCRRETLCMSGAFQGLEYFEAKNGVLSRRRMPRVCCQLFLYSFELKCLELEFTPIETQEILK